jgi:hypothetical protein
MPIKLLNIKFMYDKLFKRILTFLQYSFLVYFLTFNNSMAGILEIDGFQRPDGAITSFFGGDFVDPYFATKSLLIARNSGLASELQVNSWINWAIRIQNSNGLFGRYKINTNGAWDTILASDADDAMLALWLELLYTTKNPKKMDAKWLQSIEKAEHQLAKLLNTEKNIYHISETLPVGLLMDNAEVYSAFVNIANSLKQYGLYDKSLYYSNKAKNLKIAIITVFSSDNHYLVSTQIDNGNQFYPDKAAQLFPVIHQLINSDVAQSTYKNWISSNKDEWLEQRNHDYPWGLFAILSLEMNDVFSASCWRNHAEPMRYSKNWNILEEVSLQVVKNRLSALSTQAIPCVMGVI